MKCRKKVWLFLLTTLTACILCSCGTPQGTTQKPATSFEMKMLDVGQGLSVLLQSNNHYLLYDGGGKEASSYVVSYLKEHEISNLDYIVVSHYDEDHISGLVGVLNTTRVGEAITPDYSSNSKIYNSFMQMLDNNDTKDYHPKVGDEFELGDATVKVIGPQTYDDKNENNRSIVVKVSYQDFDCIITGDAEFEEESDLLSAQEDLDADIYIVGHHGSDTSSSERFVKAVSPEYAWISVGSKNLYGHPSEITLDILSRNHCQIVRTDKNGEISAYIENSQLFVTASKGFSAENDSKYDKEPFNGVDEYILNKKTLKFHLPSCSGVENMSEKNKVMTNKKREELIEEGYSPCGSCKP